MPIAVLPERGVVEVTGEDRVTFLQGLVSNDVTQAAPGRAVWAALLTPQGKWLADFFILAEDGRLLLDCARGQAAMLVTLLSRYRLRARVALRDASSALAVSAGWGGAAMPAGIAAPDPRLPEAGWRTLSPVVADATAEDYDAHRLSLGLCDIADMEPQKTVLLEAGFDDLSGISWTKGCYMGQELTARTRYRGLLKKRLFPVSIEGPAPAPGTLLTRDGAELGEMRSARGGIGLALLRIEAAQAGGVLAAGAARITPRIPAWMTLPQREPAA